MAAPAVSSISDAPSSSLAAATLAAVMASPPAAPGGGGGGGGGNGTHSKTGGGGGICIDLVSPHTPRGVVFNNLVRFETSRPLLTRRQMTERRRGKNKRKQNEG